MSKTALYTSLILSLLTVSATNTKISSIDNNFKKKLGGEDGYGGLLESFPIMREQHEEREKALKRIEALKSSSSANDPIIQARIKSLYKLADVYGKYEEGCWDTLKGTSERLFVKDPLYVGAGTAGLYPVLALGPHLKNIPGGKFAIGLTMSYILGKLALETGKMVLKSPDTKNTVWARAKEIAKGDWESPFTAPIKFACQLDGVSPDYVLEKATNELREEFELEEGAFLLPFYRKQLAVLDHPEAHGIYSYVAEDLWDKTIAGLIKDLLVTMHSDLPEVEEREAEYTSNRKHRQITA